MKAQQPTSGNRTDVTDNVISPTHRLAGAHRHWLDCGCQGDSLCTLEGLYWPSNNADDRRGTGADLAETEGGHSSLAQEVLTVKLRVYLPSTS